MSQLTVVVPAKGATHENPKTFFEFESDALLPNQIANYKPGQSVCLLVTLALHGAGTPVLMDSVEHDANHFVITASADSDVAAQLATSVGYLYAATFTIKSELGATDCCGRCYIIDDVTLAPLPRNPSQQEVEAMPEGTTFVVEGDYYHYLTREKSFGEPVRAGWWVIQTAANWPTGSWPDIDAIETSDNATLQGGALYGVRGSKPTRGETIRLLVTKDSKRGGMTCYRRRPVLIGPSQERRRAYTLERERVEHLTRSATTNVQEQNWQFARTQLACIRRLRATHQELMQAEELRMQIPEAERPLWDDVQALTVESLIETYGVNIEAMDPDEQIDFVRRLYSGSLPGPEGGPDPFGLLYIIRQMDRAIQASLFAEVIKTGVTRLQGLKTDSELFSNREFLLERCLHEATKYNHIDLAEAVIEFIEGCLVVKGFNRQSSPRDRNPLNLTLCAALDVIEHYKRHRLHCADGVTIDRLASWARRLCDGDASANLRSDVNAIMRVMCN